LQDMKFSVLCHRLRGRNCRHVGAQKGISEAILHHIPVHYMIFKVSK